MQAESRTIRVTVNGVTHEAEVEPRLLLVYFLRDQITGRLHLSDAERKR